MIHQRARRAALAVGCALLATTLGLEAAFAQAPSPTEPPPPATAPMPPATAPVPSTTAPPAEPPPSFPSDLQAGGLAPPPPAATTAPAAPPTQTEKDLEESKKKDSKRGLTWFWFNAEGGFSQVDLRTFSVDDTDFTVGFVPTKATGGTVGAGLGVRIFVLTIGARGRIGFFDPWQMFTVGGEIGIRIPIGRVEPHFELGGGYAALGSVTGIVQSASDAISIAGGYGRIGGGVDIFLAPWFSVGIDVSGDFLAMVRPGLSQDQIATIKNTGSLSEAQRLAADGLGLEGSSYETAWGATGVLGLHF